MYTLAQFHADVEACARAIRDDNPDWLCRLGCAAVADDSPKHPVPLRRNGIGCKDGLAALTEQLSRPIVLKAS
jgi:hypothetical protein